MPGFKWEGDMGLLSTHILHLSNNPNSTSFRYNITEDSPANDAVDEFASEANTDLECYGCTIVYENQTDDLSQLNNTNIFIPPYPTYTHGEGELFVVPLSIIILLSVLYGGISIMALIGNLLVLWVVTISRRMRTVTNMFIANLALADIIIGLFTIPFQFQAALLQRWNLPDFMCAFCPFVQVLSVNISVFTLSAIAVDRYRAVLFPLSPRVSKRKAALVIFSIWSVGLILALPTEFDYKVNYVLEKGKMKPFCENLGLSATLRMYYTLSLVVIQYFFPLIIITGAYAHMATRLWGTTAPGNKEESRDAIVLRNKKKVIKMLSLVVLLFALCWLPLQMYNFLQTFIPSINGYQYINIIWFCSHWLAMSNSCCNPFIYAIYNDKFQREFQTRLWCLRIFCTRSSDDVPNYSEGSDIDLTKLRGSYRFKNNLSVRNSKQHPSKRDLANKTAEFNNPNRHSSSTNNKMKGRRTQYHYRQGQQMNCINSSDFLLSSSSNGERSGNNKVGQVVATPITVIAVEPNSMGSKCNGVKTLTVVASDVSCEL